MEKDDREVVYFIMGLIFWTCLGLITLMEFILAWLRFRGVI